MTCVNALSRATLISTFLKTVTRAPRLTGVNALSRAFLISTSGTAAYAIISFLSCVNALSRAFLISTKATDYYRMIDNMVSMPYLGPSSFLPQGGCYPRSYGRPQCVNALSRAILISTLPLWNRLFKPLSGLVSARIFQNILKNSPDRGQKWAEGKLYFSEYNFTRDSIALL